MDIKQLQYFVVSVDMGSFCSAAEVLITTQPNVSKVVKSLETELNMILLNRDRSGVTLTKEGEHVYNYAIEILKNMRMITNFKNGFHIETLSICSIPSNIISNILSQFYNKTSNNKEFKIDFIESKVEDIMKKVHRREAELGFIYISRKNISAFKRFIKNKGLKFHEIKKVPLYKRNDYNRGTILFHHTYVCTQLEFNAFHTLLSTQFLQHDSTGVINPYSHCLFSPNKTLFLMIVLDDFYFCAFVSNEFVINTNSCIDDTTSILLMTTPFGTKKC